VWTTTRRLRISRRNITSFRCRWDGPDIRENKRLICPNTHTATHRLIDEYVRAGGDPGWEVRRHFGVYVRELARFAWDHRPPKPTITSLTGDHT
jgi:hypothetical protein